VVDLKIEIAKQHQCSENFVDIIDDFSYIPYLNKASVECLPFPIVVVLHEENRRASDRPSSLSSVITTDPDISNPDEEDTRIRMSCGHAMSKYMYTVQEMKRKFYFSSAMLRTLIEIRQSDRKKYLGALCVI
jgi:hypothetical protein